MFTGIVEAIGLVESIKINSKKSFLALSVHVPKFSKGLKIGGSLAVNGVCLTVTKKREFCVSFDVVEETIRRSTLALLSEGDQVNLERPMRASGRLDGHIVLGHVDATGVIDKISSKGAGRDIQITFPKKLRAYIFEKGSVAVDGISLTVGKTAANYFWVHCIPHTLLVTNLKRLKKGDRVNIEADALSKLTKRVKVR